jgi:hypothetical protein
MIIEYQGKRYPVIGEGDTYYICTEPWQEVEGESFYVPKNGSKIIK